MAPPPDEIRQTLHELRVHQIELEMQNEELRVRVPGLKRRYRPRSPTMAAGLTEHLWKVGDILCLPLIFEQGGVC